MKVKFIIPSLAAMFAIAAGCLAFSANAQSSDLLLSSIESLASGEGGDKITCYCALMSDASCASNNNGSSKCAGGENIKCWEYDRNCN